jgi:hypothetical protein
MDEAHQQATEMGIIHRDMTISNMYITKRDDGTMSGLLGDWGFADINEYLDRGGERRAEPLGPCSDTGRQKWYNPDAQAETHNRGTVSSRA